MRRFVFEALRRLSSRQEEERAWIQLEFLVDCRSRRSLLRNDKQRDNGATGASRLQIRGRRPQLHRTTART